jgi:hypothetical protein
MYQNSKITGPVLDTLLLLLLAAAGLLLHWPLHNYQAFLAQGDHGRDLYCFAATLKGAVPYRDYWWVYGPLMPYYYALCFKLFGLAVTGILTGQILLKIIAGLFIYHILRLTAGRLWGLIAAFWFWLFFPYFFFTYTYTGGLVLLLAALDTLARYIRNGEKRALFPGLACAVLLAFVKLNIGLCLLFGYILSVAIIDRVHQRRIAANRTFYLLAFLAAPGTIALVYGLLLKGLPFYVIRECFPVLLRDQQTRIPPGMAWAIHRMNFMKGLTVSWSSEIAYGLTGIGLLGSVFCLIKERADRGRFRATLSLLIILPLLSLLLLHEYLFSGVTYRIFWSTPVNIVLMFVLVSVLARHVPRPARLALYGLFIFLVGHGLCSMHLAQRKKSGRFWNDPRARIYTLNDSGWINTVEQTTGYLKKHLRPGEKFFALPYDPLYYYLTGTIAPTRQLMFFYNNHIPVEQQVATIADLERNHVRYIVMSNRSSSTEPGLGFFGKTHCRLLAAYLIDRFERVAVFGDWQSPPDWIKHHGTVILKRKE